MYHRRDNLHIPDVITFYSKTKSSEHINKGSCFEGLVETVLLYENSFQSDQRLGYKTFYILNFFRIFVDVIISVLYACVHADLKMN